MQQEDLIFDGGMKIPTLTIPFKFNAPWSNDKSLGKITAAAYTLPKRGPRPASSIPISNIVASYV